MFPHISRIFYMENSSFHKIFAKLKLKKDFPRLSRWYNAIKNHPYFKSSQAEQPEIVEYDKDKIYKVDTVLEPIVPGSYFRLWID